MKTFPPRPSPAELEEGLRRLGYAAFLPGQREAIETLLDRRALAAQRRAPPRRHFLEPAAINLTAELLPEQRVDLLVPHPPAHDR